MKRIIYFIGLMLLVHTMLCFVWLWVIRFSELSMVKSLILWADFLIFSFFIFKLNKIINVIIFCLFVGFLGGIISEVIFEQAGAFLNQGGSGLLMALGISLYSLVFSLLLGLGLRGLKVISEKFMDFLNKLDF